MEKLWLNKTQMRDADEIAFFWHRLKQGNLDHCYVKEMMNPDNLDLINNKWTRDRQVIVGEDPNNMTFEWIFTRT